jgi:CheY-like chemotaxis protein
MSPVRVLLAGPNNYRWRSYQETLDAAGFTTGFTSNGLDCVAVLRAFRPNVLVLDPNIPWGGGDGVLAVRHEEPGLNQNLVMILTAGCEPSLLYRMSDYAIDDLVWQPVSAAFLHQRLERLLEFSRQTQLKEEMPQPCQPS